MAMSTMTSTPATMPFPFGSPPVHRITVDEYERIIRAGALEYPGKVELVDGYLVDKMGKNPEHSYSATSAHELLNDRLPAGWSARKEEPVRIPDYDEPEPGVSVVRGVRADYRHRIPEAADVALLAEVSDSTLGQHRSKKLSAYARAGIPVYWIVNLVDRQVEVYSSPAAGSYPSPTIYVKGQQIPVTIGGHQLHPIAVDDILP
jgi:Uma2 family endonuclease